MAETQVVRYLAIVGNGVEAKRLEDSLAERLVGGVTGLQALPQGRIGVLPRVSVAQIDDEAEVVNARHPGIQPLCSHTEDASQTAHRDSEAVT